MEPSLPPPAGPPSSDVTQLLVAYNDGDRAALDRLLPLLYDELRSLARRHLRRERDDHTLSTTGLVHEAFLRLVDQRQVGHNRAHFFALAARVMRRVLVDYARRAGAARRGAGERPASFDEHAHVPEAVPENLFALAEALDRLEKLSERQARVVECRYFAGLSVEETAEALGLSVATVKRDWALARAWLYREVAGTPPG